METTRKIGIKYRNFVLCYGLFRAYKNTIFEGIVEPQKESKIALTKACCMITKARFAFSQKPRNWKATPYTVWETLSPNFPNVPRNDHLHETVTVTEPKVSGISVWRRIGQKNPHAHKNTIGTSPPPPQQKNLKRGRDFVGMGVCQQKELKCQEPKNWRSHFRPRIAGGKITDMRLFLNHTDDVRHFSEIIVWQCKSFLGWDTSSVPYNAGDLDMQGNGSVPN